MEPTTIIIALLVIAGFVGYVYMMQPVKFFDLEVRGESHYQKTIAKIAGKRTEDSMHEEVLAELVPEPENPHDKNAIRVTVMGKTVGYLSRECAACYRKNGRGREQHRAWIVGGWDRGEEDRGSFGIRVDPLPLRSPAGSS